MDDMLTRVFPTPSYGSADVAVGHALSGRSGFSGTNLMKGASHNRSMILHAVRMLGTVLRADLAEITGLTIPAVSTITSKLLVEGLLLKAGRLQKARGQPAVKLSLNPEGAFGIGLSIGRDHLTFVVMDFAGRVRFRRHTETIFAPPSAAFGFFRAAFRDLRASHIINMNRVIGIGVAIPDDLGGQSLPDQPRSYRHWGRRAVQPLAARFFQVPVFVENDAAAAAIGEMEFGLGLRRSSFLYTLIGAGLGGGLVVNGQYFGGQNRRSGEIGYLPMKDAITGKADGTILGDRVLLVELYDRLKAVGLRVSMPEDLYPMGLEGQEVVRQWIDEVATTLCDTFIHTACIVNPQSIIIGGRLPHPLATQLCDNLTKRMDTAKGRIRWLPTIEPAQLYADAAAVGAAVLPIRDQFVTGMAPVPNSLARIAAAS